jgi:hypothetical protein
MIGNYLITTDAWFTAPDGKSYRAAWGKIEILEDKFLGIKTNRNSTNWFAKLGSEKNHIIIAGCQIHYAIKCDDTPNISDTEDWQADASAGLKSYVRPTSIYIAQ